MTTQNLQLKIERKSETLTRYGLSSSTLHVRINEGLIPPPVSLGERAVGFPEHETSAVLAAMIAGNTKAEIKALVSSLIEQRKTLLCKG